MAELRRAAGARRREQADILIITGSPTRPFAGGLDYRPAGVTQN